MGNPNFDPSIGKDTQFNSTNQPDPSVVGRKLCKSFKTILEELLELEANQTEKSDEEIIKIFGKEKRITKREILMARLLVTALNDSESKSMERLMNRVDGMPKQAVDTTLSMAEKIDLSKLSLEEIQTLHALNNKAATGSGME